MHRIARTRAENTPNGLNNTAPSTHLTRPHIHIIHPSLITAIIPYLYWAAASRTSVCHNLGHTFRNPPLAYTSLENKRYVVYKRTRSSFSGVMQRPLSAYLVSSARAPSRFRSCARRFGWCRPVCTSCRRRRDSRRPSADSPAASRPTFAPSWRVQASVRPFEPKAGWERYSAESL